MRNINLKKEFEKILINNKYYLEYNRAKKINYKNYYNKPIDPDGKVRNLIKEEKYRLSQLKVITNFLKKNLIIKKRKILDVGCGFGWLLKNLDNRYWNKFGIEINEKAREVARKNKIKIFNSLKSLNNHKFDVISLVHVIEHMSNPVDDLKSLIKNIKNKGYLIIETPDFDCAMARRYNTNFRLLHDKTHISLFSSESLMRLIRDCDLKIIKIEYPFFEGPFFMKKHILQIFNSNKKLLSPPFYGSVVTIFAQKK